MHLNNLNMRNAHSTSGFTLIEIVTVISIISILGSIATPMILACLPNLHLRDASTTLLSDIHLARITAMKRNASVYIRFTDTGECPDSLSDLFPDDGGSYTISVENTSGGEDTITESTIPSDVALCDCYGSSTTAFTDELLIKYNGLPDITKETGVCVINSNLRQASIKVNLTGNITMDLETL
jgi:prepilin-type N-terminal cleavage/methylation domain-containing protein